MTAIKNVLVVMTGLLFVFAGCSNGSNNNASTPSSDNPTGLSSSQMFNLIQKSERERMDNVQCDDVISAELVRWKGSGEIVGREYHDAVFNTEIRCNSGRVDNHTDTYRFRKKTSGQWFVSRTTM